MLILSGVPGLAAQIAKEEQLTLLLRTVRFEEIDLSRQADMDEMVQLTFSNAERAGLDFSPLATTDFMERLAFACCNHWGLVIEMLIEAFTYRQVLGHKVCSKDHFSHAYAKTYSTPTGHSPFTLPNYRDGFDHNKLMEVLQRTK